MIRAFRDSQGYPEKLDFKVIRAARVYQAHQDHVGRQDQWVNQGIKVWLAYQVHQVRRVFQVILGHQDKMAQKA